ncbi:peptidase S41 [Luteitalea sp. TBR-22]|uniref:S41 family peptidase n=1 Tax=Luteitalea sp. TBR-22 TaxID=2802971 RepID=UPI001AF28DC1|nr:S41 family peptidase [Luteitalea sp. TBR-22]BCS31950.1 peptidase S41 [Luteitalea sp. TBR-22]
MRRFARAAAAALVAVLLPASSVVAQNLANCSTSSQNRYVYDVMRDIYLWDTELPTVNPASFGSPEALLEAVRYRPLDSYFSYVTSRAASNAFYSESQFVGFGFGNAYDGLGLRILQVFPDSPAAETGMRRGDRITTISGQSVAALAATNQLGQALGPSTEGYRITFRYERPDGSVVDSEMTKRPVTIPTVSELSVVDVDGKRIGYMLFRNFVTPSRDALDSAFNALRDVGATELVLDLRYNGGGLVTIAQHLGSLIGGSRTEGQIFVQYVHNARNTSYNRNLDFEARPNALNLQRLVVITSDATASASESIINSLRPFIPVVTVGTATYGKPVGQYTVEFCDKALFPVSFSVKNARGEGDYFGGIPADCQAPDDADHQLGDPAEASLAEALTVMRTGRCSAPPVAAAPEARRETTKIDQGLKRTPLDVLINAH